MAKVGNFQLALQNLMHTKSANNNNNNNNNNQ
jgi:hypothetical protein